MQITALALGIALAGANLLEINRTCLIDPVTGRPYLVVCNKAKQQTPRNSADKARSDGQQTPTAEGQQTPTTSKKPESEE